MPGLNGTDGLFKPLVDAKPSHFETITLPYPTDRTLSYKELTSYITTQLKQVEGEYVLVGESFSGPLSLFVANKKPTHLVGIILVASFIQSPNIKLTEFLPWHTGFTLTKPLYKIRMLLSTGKNLSFIKAIATEMEKVMPFVLVDRIKSIFAVDASEALRNCPVPIAYFRGTKDWVVPKRNLSKILSIRKDINVYEFPTQHFLLQAAPTDAWSAISDFLEANKLHEL